jgi:S-DNA-T family DNA segregation ATPase FtsK/SpoIIIE
VTDQRERLEHFELDLDEPPPNQHKPVFVDAVVREHDQRPIIPAAYRGQNLKVTTRRAAMRTGHRIGYHLVRVPVYAALTAGYAVRGVGVVARRQVRWAWVTEQTSLRAHAAKGGDVTGWLQLHTALLPVRKNRLMLLGVELVTLPLAGAAVVWLAPWWAAALVIAGLAVPLARAGRPVGRQIVAPAIVTARYRKLTSDIVLRAYYAAGLGHPDKDDKRITFGSTMARDSNGMGSQVLVDLPYGKGFDDAVNARGRIASGLDVALSQVYLTRDKSSHRRHLLWVADRDPLAIPAGRTPLLAGRQTDIWQPAPMGADERGRRVTVEMMWNSILIGAMPRAGKTFSARALALYAALDPYVQVSVFDGKGSPDWRKFALIADCCAFGLAPTRDGEPVDILRGFLRGLKAEVERRYHDLSQLPVSVCPEGKLTREIARNPRYKMPVRLIVLEEFQEYFDLGEESKEIAGLLVYLVKVAPAAGIIVLGSTQKPSGVGTGHVAQQFTAFRDNFQIRFGLRTGSWQVSDIVLGAGAYSEGHDSSTLLPEHKGVGILRGASERTPTVRTYLADGQDAEQILIRARALRERAGTLQGMAAGQSAQVQRRDFLADVYETYVDGEAWQSWQLVASRLAERWPDAYAEITAEAVSAQVRAFGVESRNGKTRDGQVLKGPKRAEVELAIERRSLGGR